MRTLLNTIAVEPKRWTKERVPAHDLAADILPRAAAARFAHLEVWQFHVAGKSVEECEAAREAGRRLGVDFPVVGAYPAFHLEGGAGEAARQAYYGIVDRAAALGARWVKFFFGSVKGGALTPAQAELTTARVQEWTAYGRARGLGFCAELHGNTLFDPYEYGLKYLAAHPEMEIRICFQPYDKSGTEGALRHIQDLGSQIVHAHFSGSGDGGRCRLADASLDWRRIIQALARARADFVPSVEFVRSGFPRAGEPFDWDAALADAVADAQFIDASLAPDS